MTTAVLLLCLKVFLFRIIDVSLSTIRTILSVKERALAAACIGFFEVLVWFSIVREALNTGNDSFVVAIAYAAGFAVGTYIGGKIARRFIKGNITVQIVLGSKNDQAVAAIRDAGYAVTVVNVNGSEFGDEKYMLFAEIKSARLRELKALVQSVDEHAFVMVQETKYVFNGYIKN